MKQLAQELNGKEVTVSIRAGENGRVFGSVTTAQIAASLAELGYDVDKKKISLKENVKNIGIFEAEVRLMEGVCAKIKINVIPLQ